MKHKIKIISFVLTVILLGCSDIGNLDTPTFAPTMTLSIPIPKPSSTPVQQYVSPTPQKGNDAIPERAVKYQCLNIGLNMPIEETPIGKIILLKPANNAYSQPVGQALIYDIASSEILPLTDPEEYVNSYATSPNGRNFAFLNTQVNNVGKVVKTSLEIVQPNGNENFYSWENDWRSILKWRNEESIEIGRRRWSGNGAFELDTVVVINPETREQQELLPSFDGIHIFDIDMLNWGMFGYSRTIYDPTLTRVIYPALDTNASAIILAEVGSGNIIKTLHDLPSGFGNMPPKWAINGDVFFVTLFTKTGTSTYEGKYQLYAVSRDGIITQLTYITDGNAGNFTPSPDGQYVAYWLTTENPSFSGTGLTVLDVNTGETINYCLRNFDRVPQVYSAPIWSPDGKHLVIAEGGKGSQENRVIVMNIENKWAVEIAQNLMPIGWIANP